MDKHQKKINVSEDIKSLGDDNINKLLISVYSDLETNFEFLSAYPGLEVLREWAKQGFSDNFLDQNNLSLGMKNLIKSPWLE